MLTLLLLLPIAGALIVGFFPGNIEAKRLRQVTELFAILTLIWSLLVLFKFDLTNSQFQFQETLAWIPQLGLTYSLGIDGLSLPLVILNGLLTGVAIYSIGPNLDRSRLYYALILLINAGVSGALMSQNLLLFIIFYELELIPFYLM
ncbi:MAG: dehydrogenase subunit 4, Involved in fixation, partial [Cyanobacteriota bacterium]